MVRWKLALGAVIVLAIGVWDVGIPGANHVSSRPAGPATRPHGSAWRLAAAPLPRIPGVLQPNGVPHAQLWPSWRRFLLTQLGRPQRPLLVCRVP